MRNLTKNKLKIGIIGPGAVGGVLSTLLAHKGFNIELTKKIKSDNEVVIDNTVYFDVTGEFGDFSCLVPYVEYNNFSDKKDIIFVCTGAYHFDRCLQDAVKQLTPNGVIVAIHNVITMDELVKYIPVNKIVMWYIDWNSVRVNKREFFVYTKGDNHIGAFTSKLDMPLLTIQKVLNTISNTVVEQDFPAFMFSRFMLDSSLMCLGALTGRSVGGFLSVKQGKKVFIELIREQVEILRQANIPVLPYQGVFDYEKFEANTVSGIFYRKKMIERLIKQNGHIVSRVLRRIESNKRSEIDWLIGKSVQNALKYKVKAPYCNALYECLKQIEAKERTICIENLHDEMFTQI